MARLLILTDRGVDDTDWKGALTWRIIKSLAESQHEVMVASPLEFDEPPVEHPRLNLIRPVNSWRLDQLPKLMKALLQFQPQIVHTFALEDRGLWPKLSVWPYFSGMCAVVPGLKCVATVFDSEDANPATESWHKQAAQIVMFSKRQAQDMSPALGRLGEVLPLDLPQVKSEGEVHDAALIPASVSEWEFPEEKLIHVRDLLLRFPHVTLRIIGGWGSWSASQKREGWNILEPVAARVQMREAMGFNTFLEEMARTRQLWLDPLRRASWKFLIASELANKAGKKVLLSSPLNLELPQGSTANSLSRLYSL